MEIWYLATQFQLVSDPAILLMLKTTWVAVWHNSTCTEAAVELSFFSSEAVAAGPSQFVG